MKASQFGNRSLTPFYVLLCSATPSLESWNNVREGKYELATMRLRIDDRKLPLIRIIDMRNEGRKSQSGPTILCKRQAEHLLRRAS